MSNSSIHFSGKIIRSPKLFILSSSIIIFGLSLAVYIIQYLINNSVVISETQNKFVADKKPEHHLSNMIINNEETAMIAVIFIAMIIISILVRLKLNNKFS